VIIGQFSLVVATTLGRLKQCLTVDADVFLTHLIYSEWVKNIQMSTLTFNIAQFFPSINYQLLSLILNKASFDSKVSIFFSNYLIGRKTQYLWNNFVSLFFNVNISIIQGSALFPILSALYISSIFHIFEKRSNNIKIPVSFVDDGLFISQEKSLEKTNSYLFCSYNIISSLLDQFGLIIEHRKTKVFYFSRSHSLLNPPPLDLSHIGEPIICPKNSWKYLGFIFNRKLLFQQYVKFYSNKALSMVKSIKMLGNSS